MLWLYALFVLVPLGVVGLLWLLDVRRPWVLLSAAALGGALPGAFLASAASTVASTQTLGQALLEGIGVGLAVGLLIGVIVVFAGVLRGRD